MCKLKICKIQKPDEDASKVILDCSDHKSDEKYDTESFKKLKIEALKYSLFMAIIFLS